MSFYGVLKLSIAALTKAAKELDDKCDYFCYKLAGSLDIDKTKLLLEFNSILSYMAIEQKLEEQKLKNEKRQEMELAKEIQKA
jgi:hypothetical protein